MASDFIVDVNEEDFEYEVLSYSDNTPVVVDFWAPWCRPCKVLGPLLEKIAAETPGSFRLARVNVDENPNLAMQYGIRSIPAVKAFSEGEIVAQFSGNLPEDRVRSFINQITPPSPASLLVEKATSLLSLERWEEAEELFRELEDMMPRDPEVLLGLARALLGQGQAEEADAILSNFPASRLFGTAEKIRPYAQALLKLKSGDLPDDTELDAAFQNSLRLAGRGNQEAALDGLLDILRQDRRFRGGKAREIVLALLELLGEDNPLTRTYRSELASVLF
jgi:putative thioredoxin